ncbi:MAG TPA: YXWGXW repeat-containing protein [Terriglobales bacterium]|nr:YXWGXW repeat-containing protein [Terriglobales bacterium]
MRIGRSARFVSFALVVLALSAALFAQVSIAIRIGPPPLPVYVQPACPAEGYIWTPGYWAYDYHDGDYYWVPGTWVMPPEVGFLWTPGYWGWVSDRFVFHEGYWGPRVGFYGGINYGFGYFGSGYEGGRWDHDRFFYNRAVSNVNVTNIHNVYNTTVINNITVNHVSYNGGQAGINARPTAEQESAERERHIPQVAAQVEHVQAARANNELRASVNHGQPRVAATPRPGAFEDREVVSAGEASSTNRGEAEPRSSGPGSRPANYVPRPGSAVHPNDLPPRERPAFPNTGSTELDKKYLQQQEKLLAKQDQERQRLQQKQDQEHQKLARQNADEIRQQQLEQRHQQQTQDLQQRHTQQQQHLQQKQQAVSRSRA